MVLLILISFNNFKVFSDFAYALVTFTDYFGETSHFSEINRRENVCKWGVCIRFTALIKTSIKSGFHFRLAIQRNALRFPMIWWGNTTSMYKPLTIPPSPAVKNVCGSLPLLITRMRWWTNLSRPWWRFGRRMGFPLFGLFAVIPATVRPTAIPLNSKVSSLSITLYHLQHLLEEMA